MDAGPGVYERCVVEITLYLRNHQAALSNPFSCMWQGRGDAILDEAQDEVGYITTGQYTQRPSLMPLLVLGRHAATSVCGQHG